MIWVQCSLSSNPLVHTVNSILLEVSADIIVLAALGAGMENLGSVMSWAVMVRAHSLGSRAGGARDMRRVRTLV